MITPIERAITQLGGLSAFASAVGVKPPTVVEWRKNIRPIPPKRCVSIERLTGYKVTRQEIRPDDWQEIWPELVEQQHEA